MTQQPVPTAFKLDFGGRDFACLAFALAVHSLLLLWKGGLLSLPDEPGAGLGDMIASVDFRTDIPSYEPQGGGSAPKAEGFLARVKSLMKSPAAEKSSDIAMGNTVAPIETPKSNWAKTDVFKDKPFAEKKGFDGLIKKDALDIAKGQTQEVVTRPSAGNFSKAEPNLKENKFKLAQKDVPFKIQSSDAKDQLVNVNAVQVNVGEKTSASVRSLDGGPGSGPALQTKTLAPRGSSSFGGAGFSGSSPGKSGGAGGLAMGSNAAPAGAGGMTTGGAGFGTGTGVGSGTGPGNGSGRGNGNGGGKSWGGGGTGAGFGGTGSQMQTLTRNTISDGGATGAKAPYNGGFNITGALANRPIMQKYFAKYEIDGRVSLRFRVDWSGKVLDGIIVEVSSGNPTFDQKVVASLQQWLFSKLPPSRTNEIQEGVVTFVFKGV